MLGSSLSAHSTLRTIPDNNRGKGTKKDRAQEVQRRPPVQTKARIGVEAEALLSNHSSATH